MIVYAVNVHTGGGKVLLDELLINEPFGKVTALLHDSRYVVPAQKRKSYVQVSVLPSLVQRMKAELTLKKILAERPSEFVLFFGNLPPLFVRPKNSALYLQNCILLPEIKIQTKNMKAFVRLTIEKLILKLKIKSVSEVWVQTDWMAQSLSRWTDVLVQKKPFLPSLPPVKPVEKVYDFLSVTSTAKHKNLEIFLQALKVLDQLTTTKIKVAIVLDEDKAPDFVKPFIAKNIELDVLTKVSRGDLFEIYQKSKNAVVTSLYESYSLPLYEALHFKLSVICPNEAYTNEVKDLVVRYKSDSATDLAEKMLRKI